MREKFVFIGSTDTTGSDLKPLPEATLRERDRLKRKVIELLRQHAEQSETAETGALNTLKRELSATDKHAALWKYEKAHLAAGENWPLAKYALQNYKEATNRRIFVTDFLGSFGSRSYGSTSTAEDLNRGTAQVEGLLNPEETNEERSKFVKLGTVFLGDARFTDLRPQPPGLLNKIYVLGRIVSRNKKPEIEPDPIHTNSHFVWLPKSETYVRRFVTRGLNHNDLVNISRASALGAPVQVVQAQKQELSTKDPSRHAVTEGVNLTEAQQILSHTRGWQKRYISTGVSNRPVYSTRGTQFMSIYGTAVIDLAKVDLNTVFDVHSPIAVRNVLGWDPSSVVTATGPGNNATTFTGEEFLALRDVLRTRELLIKFTVPFAALNYIPDGDRVLGLGSGNIEGPKRVLGMIRKWQRGWPSDDDTDVLRYKGYNNRYWLFILFNNNADREDFCINFRSPPGTQVLRLRRYVMPLSLAGWK
jgi:hypothetical protein